MNTEELGDIVLRGTQLNAIITDEALRAYRAARTALANAIIEAEDAGYSANGIAERLSGSFGQPAVFGQGTVISYVGALRIAKKARKALAEAGLADYTTVRAMGPDSPIGALLQLAGPEQCEGIERTELPGRIRAALAPALLTIDSDSDSDDMLLTIDGLGVLITKIKPSI